jgi:hypothetical protein
MNECILGCWPVEGRTQTIRLLILIRRVKYIAFDKEVIISINLYLGIPFIRGG